jgi:hypothetical protein
MNLWTALLHHNPPVWRDLQICPLGVTVAQDQRGGFGVEHGETMEYDAVAIVVVA